MGSVVSVVLKFIVVVFWLACSFISLVGFCSQEIFIGFFVLACAGQLTHRLSVVRSSFLVSVVSFAYSGLCFHICVFVILLSFLLGFFDTFQTYCGFPSGFLFSAVCVMQLKCFYVTSVDYLAGVAGFVCIGFCWVLSSMVYWLARLPCPVKSGVFTPSMAFKGWCSVEDLCRCWALQLWHCFVFGRFRCFCSIYGCISVSVLQSVRSVRFIRLDRAATEVA